jgi:hypothetical protein
MVSASLAVTTKKAIGKDSATQVPAELVFDVAGQRARIGPSSVLEERLEVLANDAVQRCLGGATRGVRHAPWKSGRRAGHDDSESVRFVLSCAAGGWRAPIFAAAAATRKAAVVRSVGLSMKTGLDHLPQHKRDQILVIAALIQASAAVEMIILFGSYARGN